MELAAGEVHFIIAGAFHPDVAAMGFDDALRESQSQPGTAAFKAGLACGMLGQFPGLVELAEDDIP